MKQAEAARLAELEAQKERERLLNERRRASMMVRQNHQAKQREAERQKREDIAKKQAEQAQLARQQQEEAQRKAEENRSLAISLTIVSTCMHRLLEEQRLKEEREHAEQDRYATRVLVPSLKVIRKAGC